MVGEFRQRQSVSLFGAILVVNQSTSYLSIWPRNRAPTQNVACGFAARILTHPTSLTNFRAKKRLLTVLKVGLFWRRKIVIGFAWFLTIFSDTYFTHIEKNKTTKNRVIYILSLRHVFVSILSGVRGSTYQIKGGFPLSRNFYVRK